MLKDGGSEEPLFLLHEMSGDVLHYTLLCEQLPKAIPIIGLQLTNHSMNNTIETMARAHLEKILLVQPRGPYRIAGYSMGGLLAFEVASQLVNSGESVAFLGIIDSDLSDDRSDPNATGNTAWLLELLHSMLPRETAKHLDDLRKLSTLEAIVRRCHQLHVFPSPEAATQATQWLDNFRVCEAASHNYRPTRQNVAAHLFATGPVLPYADSWSTLSADGLTVIGLDGTHHSIINDAVDTRALGRHIGNALQGVDMRRDVVTHVATK
jgi:thioesterase domain-containing protein